MDAGIPKKKWLSARVAKHGTTMVVLVSTLIRQNYKKVCTGGAPHVFRPRLERELSVLLSSQPSPPGKSLPGPSM